jgi:hypothetical protein
MRTKLILLLSIISLNAFSQDLENVDGAAVYFKAGVNLSNLVKWDDNEPTNAIYGPSGGMGVYVGLGKPKRFSRALAIEAAFSGEGFSLEHNDETIKARLTYFNLSLMMRQYIGHMYLTAGPERAFLVSAKEIYGTENEYAPDGIYKNGVWNAIGGIGVNFGGRNMRQVDFGFELTYKHGLSQVRTDFIKARQSGFNLSMFIPMSIIGEIAAGM